MLLSIIPINLFSPFLENNTPQLVVLATFMMTEIMGLPISISFIFILVFLTLEMSLASPGTTISWVIAFETFSMPADYVGLFSTYRLFTKNYSTVVVAGYNMCELLEMACKMDEINNPDAAGGNPEAVTAGDVS